MKPTEGKMCTLLCFNTTDSTVLYIYKVPLLTHSSESAVWNTRWGDFLFFLLSTPDVCCSLRTKRCCVWHFSFHGNWNMAGWKKIKNKKIFAYYSPALPRSHFWSTDLLATRGVNMVIRAFIWLEADELQFLSTFWFSKRKLQTAVNAWVSAFLFVEWKNHFLKVWLMIVVVPFCDDHNTQFTLVFIHLPPFLNMKEPHCQFPSPPKRCRLKSQLTSKSALRWKHSASQWKSCIKCP